MSRFTFGKQCVAAKALNAKTLQSIPNPGFVLPVPALFLAGTQSIIFFNLLAIRAMLNRPKPPLSHDFCTYIFFSFSYYHFES